MLSGEIADRYVIEDELGRGGTAVVYRARDRGQGRDVAIKLLRDDAIGSLSIERFLREIRLTAQLPHPHIVPVLDSGEHEGRPYFVLPLMEGGTLRQRLAREKQLPLEEVVSIGIILCKALEFAHAHGLIHRDVKPENILYTGASPCLADFGTARALESAANDPTTSTGIIRGTPAYMSPEQASGERSYDGRSDIYSLGCVLYEAIAGIPPFVGPTAQAVIFQRLAHAPRPVSVFRPNVPVELEDVLAKATSLIPADRYATAASFGAALEATIPALTRPRTSQTTIPVAGAVARRPRNSIVIAVSIAAIAAAVAFTLVNQRVFELPWVLPGPGDTTRVAILPFEVTGAHQEIAGEDLMYEGMRRWSGLSPVEPYATNDAVRQQVGAEPLASAIGPLSIPAVASISSRLGAGRYIRGHIIDNAAQRVVRGSLFDISSRRALYSAEVPLPTDPTRMPSTYAALADSLVLRGAHDGAPTVPRFATANLPAVQMFMKARGALADWNLPSADSLFTRSIQFDSTAVTAKLWQAQVRSWRGLTVSAWAGLARAAHDQSQRLSIVERRQAAALAALGGQDFPLACRLYGQIVAASPKDFAGWYGLGECRRLDHLVIADTATASGWRFRSSYEQSILAYKKAFEVFPSSYRSLSSNAFQPIRLLLHTDGQNLVQGFGHSPEGRFLARPVLAGDTVAFIPYPVAVVYAGQSHTDPIAVAAAVARNRRLLTQVAARWASAFPYSSGAKEGIAVSLEMIGDPAAADSFRAARALTRDTAQRLRLAVEEVVTRLKMGIAEQPTSLSSSTLLADSLLSTVRPATTADAELLLMVAMVTGRCRDIDRLARIAGGSGPSLGAPIPPSLLGDVHSAFGKSIAGCNEAGALPAVASQLARLGVSPAIADEVEYDLLGAAVGLRFPKDPAAVQRLGRARPDYILTLENSLIRGDTVAARASLEQRRPLRRAAPPGTLSVDVALTEARLWLVFHDTATAEWLLDSALRGLRYAPPLTTDDLLPNMLKLGAIGPAIELRANIATHDGLARRRWAATLADLWKRADPELQTRAKRTESLSH